MYVTIVYVHVKPEHVADFIEAIRANHEASVREPGNLRFDILQSVDDPTRFVAYEAYRDEASAKAHKETAHYQAWRDTVTDWMAEPRQGVRYDGLFRRSSRRPMAPEGSRSNAWPPFSIARLPRILFGAGRSGELPAIIARASGRGRWSSRAAPASPKAGIGLALAPRCGRAESRS